MHAAARTSQRSVSQVLPRINVNSKDNLLLMATSRFCARKDYDRLSMSQYKEAFYLLAEHVTDDTKQKVAHFLAERENVPRQVALYLALEPLSTSAPVLSYSPSLGQLDMLRIVDLRGVDYAIAIATRPDLGPNLVRRLRQFENQAVHQALEDNYAITNLSREKRANIHFADATGFATELNYNGEEVTAVTETPSELETKASPVHQSQAETALLKAAARGGRVEETIVHQTEVNPSKDYGEIFEKAARSGNRQTMMHIMSVEAGLTPDSAIHVLSDQTGDTLSVFLNAHDVSASQTNRILLLTYPSIGLSVQNARRAMNFYDQLNPASSRKAVAQWPKTTNNHPKHQTYLQDTSHHRIQRSAEAHTPIAQLKEQERKTG